MGARQGSLRVTRSHLMCWLTIESTMWTNALVAGEEPVPAGEQVALQPALAGVFGQDLHHPAVPVEMLVHLEHLGLPGLAAGGMTALETVGGGPRPGADQAGSPAGRWWLRITPSSRSPRIRVGSCRVAPGLSTGTAYRSSAGRGSSRSSSPPLGGGWNRRLRAPSGTQASTSARGAPCSSNSSSGRYDRSHASSCRRWSGLSRTAASGPGGAPGALDGKSVDFGRTGPALRGAQHDHRPAGRSPAPSSRAARWTAAMRSSAVSMAWAIARWMASGSSPVTWIGSSAVPPERRVEVPARAAWRGRSVGDLCSR